MTRFVHILIIAIFSIANVSAGEPTLHGSRHSVRTSTDVLAVAMPAATLTFLLAATDYSGLKQGVLTAATATTINYLIKYTVSKRRPDGSDNHSFPSMHTTTVFADAAFLHRRFGWKIGLPAYMAAAYVGWGRTYARKHDWWDVGIGAAIGVGSAFIFTHPYARQHNLSIMPYSSGEYTGVAASFTF